MPPLGRVDETKPVGATPGKTLVQVYLSGLYAVTSGFSNFALILLRPVKLYLIYIVHLVAGMTTWLC